MIGTSTSGILDATTAKAEYDRQKQIASEKRIHEGEVVDYFKVSCCRKRGR